MRAVRGLALLSLLGCGAEPLDADVSAVNVPGPWRLPPSTAAIGDRQYVRYTGSPRIADGGRCTSTNPFACSCSHPACSRGLPGTLEFAAFIRRRFPQIRGAGGFDCCRQNTGNTAYLSVHSIGRAIDLMIPRINNDADNTAGDAVANWLVENAQNIGVQIVIWDRSSWRAERAPGTKLQPYTGPIPHTDHIHMELSVDAANRRTPFFTSGASHGDTCTPRCDGARIVSADCSVGDCAAYGATCLADPTPRCVHQGCPPTGAGFICLDRGRRAECRNGLIASVGDCGAFGSFCSVAGVAPTAARCTLSLCVSGPEMVPAAHVACSITAGRLLDCDANGVGREIPCAAGQVCSVLSGAARCEPPWSECPVPATGAPADDRTVCLGNRVARCFNGNVIAATACGADGACSALGGSAHCAQRACLDGQGRPRAGDVCVGGSSVARCDATGSFEDVRPCAAGRACVEGPGGAACETGEVDAGSGAVDGGAEDDDLPSEMVLGRVDAGSAVSDAGSDAGSAVSDAGSARDAFVAEDAPGYDALVGSGCGCRARRGGGARGWGAALGALAALRARARARRGPSRRGGAATRRSGSAGA